MRDLWNDHENLIHPSSTADYMGEDQLRTLQLQRLRAVTKHAYENQKLFRERMDAKGLTPEDIKTLEDVNLLPFTQKTDLRDTYPYGLFCVPMNEVVRLHASSGTTGKPIVVAYTEEDIEVWKEVMVRTFACAGLHHGDIIQNAYGYGLFTGGLGAHYGAEALGATVIPISGGNSERQIMVMRDFGSTAICSTPSYFLHLIEYAEEMGVDWNDIPLRAGVFGAEPWSDEMREYIEGRTGIKAYDIYGLSEIIGPGVASACSAQRGLHIFEDHFLFEIVDPVTDEPMPDGEEGELIITTLSKRAMPVMRYRTHDITSVITEKCSCGRTVRRIERIARRSDDMFIIRGVNVFPSQVEAALLKAEGTLPHYQIILTNQDGMDQMEVQVEVTDEVFSDTVRGLEELKKKIHEAITHILGIRVKLTLAEPNTIARSQGKAKRVIDQRNK
ncbi:phenylacetate--CoA ligase family protein [Tichowtungia aerotolerans]|uniref:Phenylacetate-coenzyme A ligase n=1 Tax=Tichowtungia aerotolerans TaxID=2697043 RepID=A0A6P1MEY1_9BACT|nr:phenylacetate--CoA ligase [Tichowtungia aerotolerans]QHI70578.1 AMP-binding protein [Tichowtungia aerotolerans]